MIHTRSYSLSICVWCMYSSQLKITSYKFSQYYNQDTSKIHVHLSCVCTIYSILAYIVVFVSVMDLVHLLVSFFLFHFLCFSIDNAIEQHDVHTAYHTKHSHQQHLYNNTARVGNSILFTNQVYIMVLSIHTYIHTEHRTICLQ